MDLEKILHKYVGGEGWKIRKPPAGLSKESYLASQAGKEVFIKLDSSLRYLDRLAEIGITPKVIASGVENNETFIIQESFPGVHPSAAWFQSHMGQVARLVNAYHSDPLLKDMLMEDKRISTPSDLFEGLKTLSGDPRYTEATRTLESTLPTVSVDSFVPVHGDPNKKNFLALENNLKMIDWDDVVLSDPLRDVGLLCYWYLPKEKWGSFFNELNLTLNPESIARIFWWVAGRSLEIFQWFKIRGQDNEADNFLEDAIAALNNSPNPHAKF